MVKLRILEIEVELRRLLDANEPRLRLNRWEAFLSEWFDLKRVLEDRSR
jgi:hypothetical protein